MNEPHDGDSQGEVLKASGPGASQIQLGMEVTSLDGERVGKV